MSAWGSVWRGSVLSYVAGTLINSGLTRILIPETPAGEVFVASLKTGCWTLMGYVLGIWATTGFR